jgi:predicted ATPase/signal transduction histidine kinase/ActR/RegA family two-component response regulator
MPEKVQENSLRELIRGTKLPISEFLRLASAICDAVEQMHHLRRIHLDIAPDTVCFDMQSMQAKLTGVGITLGRGPAEAASPRLPTLLEGRLPYISPEQTGRTGAGIDSRSDLYSLGVTFYEMLAGELPFQARDALDWMHLHIAGTPRSLSQTRPELPAVLSDIVAKLLAKAPDERYQSAVGLKHDLLRLAHQLETGGALERFELGASDVPLRLRVPERLYGRETQVAQLTSIFERVALTGQPELTIVSGEPGIGKSALVDELRTHVRGRALFASGKFEQYQRGIPYSTLVQAFRHVAQQMLAGSAEALELWRGRIKEALGTNAKVITDVIPEVRFIVGEVAEAPALGPVETQNRFNLAFHQFVQALATPSQPLVLFLDDMQWADVATLKVLESLFASTGLRHVYLLFTYRDTEVDAAHPLEWLIGKLRSSPAKLGMVTLQPLNQANVADLVHDTLRCSTQEACSLAELIYRKTDGNPFFVRELLKSLYDEKLLQFDADARRWRWRENAIEAAGITDNVVDLVILRLRRLSPQSQRVLQVAACMGSSFDVRILAPVYGASQDETFLRLREAGSEGLIRPAADPSTDESAVFWQFRHDRIQQAAYSTLEPDGRKHLHLRIGRIMLASVQDVSQENGLFDLVNQLNLGHELMEDTNEREQLATLNLLAGQKAMAASAYGPALRYLTQATDLMPPDAWQTDYERVYSAHLQRAECEYLVGDFTRAEALLKSTLDQSRSTLDRARVYAPWLLLYQISGRFSEGVKLGTQALALFDVVLPEDSTEIAQAIEAEHNDIQALLAGRDINELLNAPLMTDPTAKALISLLSGLGPLTYLGRPEAFPLIPLKMVSASLRQGNSAESCFAYSMYAMLLVSVFEDIDAGYAFSQMALRLNEKLHDPRLRGVLLHVHANHVSFWRKPYAESLPFIDKAFTASVEAGDFTYSNYAAFMAGWLQFERGVPLEELRVSSERYLAFARQSRNRAVYDVICLEQQLVAALQGRTKSYGSLSDESFNEHTALERIAHDGLATGVLFYYAERLVLHVIFGQTDEALRAAKEARSRLGKATALPVEVSLSFFEALASSAAYLTTKDTDTRSQFLQIVRDSAARLERWSRDCPHNFAAKCLLVSAELAQLQDNTLEAMRLYEQAVRAAQDAGALHDEAITHERAAAFYERQQLASLADFSLLEARRAYADWGADGKVAQLDEHHPRLVSRAANTRTSALRPVERSRLDLMSAIKASQAISSEIVLPQLSQTLMKLVTEHAGAERACLVLLSKDSYSVEAETCIAPSAERSRTGTGGVPESVVNFVRRTDERVLIEDASRPNPFSADPYFADRILKSVLCLPVAKQGRLFGMLYLENSQLAGAFTPDRLTVLELLAAQTAISLENARLYREAGLLASTQRYANQLKGLAEVSVKLNSLAAVEPVLELIAINARELIGAHQSVTSVTTQEGWSQALTSVSLSERYAAWRSYDEKPNGSGIYALVCAQNKPMRLSQAELEAHPAWRGFGAHAAKHPPMRGWLAVPMVARDGSNIGLIQLSDKYSGDFTEEDETLLVQLAQLASAVIERAQADERLREADRRKDEFLAMLAHELRNPLAPISAAAELLKLTSLEPDRVRRTSQIISRQVSHMTSLINDLLDVSRVTRGLVRLEKATLDAKAIVADAIEQVRPLIEEHAHYLEVYLAPEVVFVEGDHKRLVQVFTNILSNSAKYTPRGGRIQLHMVAEQQEIIFAIRDNGIGMAPELIARVFDLFSQAERTSDRSQGGLGLGLALVKSLVELHGGSVQAHSTGLGAGSEFVIRLPRIMAREDIGRQFDSMVEAGTPARPLRVLVVDDNKDAASMLAMFLESNGHEVIVKHSAIQALEQAAKSRPDVCLIDIGLPGMDGNELVRRMRSDPHMAEVVLIAITGYGQPQDRERAMAAGFDHYFVKPVDTQQLNTLLATTYSKADHLGT